MKSLLMPVVVVTFIFQAYTLMQMNQIQGRLQQINEMLPVADIKMLKAEPSLGLTDGADKPLPAGKTEHNRVRM